LAVTKSVEHCSSLRSYANAAVIALALLFAACSEEQRMAAPSPASPQESGDPLVPASHIAALPVEDHEIGIASWYGRDHQGKRTASGVRFDMFALTAAHPSLPLGSVVLVENLANGRSVGVRAAPAAAPAGP
jgi:rare lipoprotein A (RlpA)-like double-psi beta-barrel protein